MNIGRNYGFSLYICPEMGFLGHMVALFLFFKGTSLLSSIVVIPVNVPTNSVGAFLFSTSSPVFMVCRLFDDGHFDWCEAIPHCRFDLHFSNN